MKLEWWSLWFLSFSNGVEHRASIRKEKEFWLCCWSCFSLAQPMPFFCGLWQKRCLPFPQHSLPFSVPKFWNPERGVESEIKSWNKLGWEGKLSGPSQSRQSFLRCKCSLEVSWGCWGLSQAILESLQGWRFHSKATCSVVGPPFLLELFFFPDP